MTRISVIIPVFDRAAVLYRAVESVLQQSYSDLQLIIVDDGSTEDVHGSLYTALQDPRTHLIRHEVNLGAAAARNTGVAHSDGEYLAFLDSDDRWHPEKLERQLAFMQGDVDRRKACCTGYRLVTEASVSSEYRTPNTVVSFDELLWGCRLSPGSTLMVDRSLFDVVGSFDEKLRRLEDWEWLLRCSQRSSIKGLPHQLVDVQHDSYADVSQKQLMDSAKILSSYVREQRYQLSWPKRRILLSTIHNEVAAIHYRQRSYGRALLAFARSLRYYPWKNRSSMVALLSTVRKDVAGILRGRR